MNLHFLIISQQEAILTWQIHYSDLISDIHRTEKSHIKLHFYYEKCPKIAIIGVLYRTLNRE